MLVKKITGLRHGLGSVSHWLTWASPSGTDSGTRSDADDVVGRGAAVAGHDTLAAGDGVRAFRRQDEALDVDQEPAVREELRVAFIDRPRVAGTGHPGDDRARHGEPDELDVEDLVMSALGRGNGPGPEDQTGQQGRCDGETE